MKFLVKYSGQISGTWSRSTARGARCGAPSEEHGSFDSTLGPSAKPLTVVVSNDLGTVNAVLSTNRHVTRITTSRTGEGWRTKGDCYPYADPFGHIPSVNSGCGTRTFTGLVAFQKLGSSLRPGPKPYGLSWYVEPDNAVRLDCPAGPYDDGDAKGRWFDQTARAFSWASLYRCGVRRPRGCRLTVGATRAFSKRDDYHGVDYPDREGPSVATETVRVRWSVTFVAVGRT